MKPCRRNTFKSLFFFVAVLSIAGCTLESVEQRGDECPDYAFLIHNDDLGNTIVECVDNAESSEYSRNTCPLDAQYCLKDEADRNFCAINVSLGKEEAKKFPCRSSSEDENCDCPDHQICVNNKCFDDPDTGCKCKEDETCDHGTCLPASKKCSEDDDCAKGLVCLNDICTKPVTNLKCSVDEDCTEGLVCLNDICTNPNTNLECTGDEDCTEGLVCIDEICTEHAIDCSEDEDCPEGLVCVDDICSNPIIECSGDEDCPEGMICVDDICSEPDIECSGDEDCPEGLVCLGDICTEPFTPIECTVDGDCASGEICSSGFCVDPEIPFECVADIDCSEGQSCQSNVCIDVTVEPECSETKPCSGELICKDNTCQSCPDKTYYLAGKCVECKSHENCGENAFCTTTNTCTVCPGDQKVNTEKTACVGCVTSDHCGSNAYCNTSNTCVNCGSKVLNDAKNACVECTKHDHCPSNAYCNANACVNCGSKVVNDAKNACVDCTKHDHCPSNAYCSANACVNCGSKVVNAAKTACVDCTNDSHCPSGYECKSEKCKQKSCDNTREVFCNDGCVTSGGNRIIITATSDDNYQTEVKSEPKSSSSTIGGYIRYDTPEIFGQTTTSNDDVWYIVLLNGKKGYVSSRKAKQLPVSFTSSVNLAIFSEVGSGNTGKTISSGTIYKCHDAIVNGVKWCYAENGSKKGWGKARNADGNKQSDIAKVGNSVPSGYYPPECK